MAAAFQYLKECPVCKEEFTDPRVFPCGHSLCVDCIGQIKKRNQIKCPECNEVHDIGKVRRDFRLMQFLDVMKEERKIRTAAPKQDDEPLCESCLREGATHWCKNCKQWFCKECKRRHTRMASSKHHELEPISKKIEDMKAIYAERIRSIKNVFEDSSVTVKEIGDQLSELESSQVEALKTSKMLREHTIEDIEEYFDSIDAKILSFIQNKMEKLEKKRLELRESKTNLHSLERMINDNSRELLTEGKAMFKKVKDAQKTQMLLDFDREKVVIEVAQEALWDPATAATLTMKTVKVAKGRTGLSTKQSEVPSAIDRTNLLPKKRTPMVAKQHDPEHVHGKLSSLASTRFEKIGEVACSDDVRGLRVIDNQLWSCQEQKCEIFDKNLKRIRSLQNEAWGSVWDVALMPNSDIIIACENGLLQIDDAGKTKTEIESGEFTSVDIDKGVLYASRWDTISGYTYSNGSWSMKGSIKLAHSGYNTISVKNGTITICFFDHHIIEVLNMLGKPLHTFGRKGIENAGELQNPNLCQEDSDRTLLVADSDNNRLQLLDRYRKWSIIDVKPKLRHPQRAMYVGDTLYVQGGDWPNHKLCKYTAK